MLTEVTSWWRTHFVLGSTQRFLMYQVIETQIAAGLSPQKAFETLRHLVRLSPAISQVAQSASVAGAEGRLVTEGLAESGCIPNEELGVLKVAERHNRLDVACLNIRKRAFEKLSMASSVLAPNLYYLMILLVLLFFTWQAKDILSAASHIEISNIPAYKLSSALRQWGLVAVVCIVFYMFMVVHGRTQWLGFYRRFLLFFDADYRAHLTIRIADLGAALYAEGASHTEFLEAIEEAFGRERYAHWATSIVRQRYIGDGDAIESAMADILLPRHLTTLLAALTPGSQQHLYVTAYQTVSRIQRAQLQGRYIALMASFRAVVLISATLLILLLVHGVYSAVLVQPLAT